MSEIHIVNQFDLKQSSRMVYNYHPYLVFLINDVNRSLNESNQFAFLAEEIYSSAWNWVKILPWYVPKITSLKVHLLQGDITKDKCALKRSVTEVSEIENGKLIYGLNIVEAFLAGHIEGQVEGKELAIKAAWNNFVEKVKLEDRVDSVNLLGSIKHYAKLFKESND